MEFGAGYMAGGLFSDTDMSLTEVNDASMIFASASVLISFFLLQQ